MRDRRRGRCIGGVGGGEGQEKGTVYWRDGGRGGAREGDGVLEGWGEGRKNGRVEERERLHVQ